MDQSAAFSLVKLLDVSAAETTSCSTSVYFPVINILSYTEKTTLR